jgi:hypothetical protein
LLVIDASVVCIAGSAATVGRNLGAGRCGSAAAASSSRSSSCHRCCAATSSSCAASAAAASSLANCCCCSCAAFRRCCTAASSSFVVISIALPTSANSSSCSYGMQKAGLSIASWRREMDLSSRPKANFRAVSLTSAFLSRRARRFRSAVSTFCLSASAACNRATVRLIMPQ